MQTHWIAHEALASTSVTTLDVVNPATGQRLDEIPEGTATDAARAVDAARAATDFWASCSPTQRRGYLHEGAQRVREHAETIAEELVRENGKPRRDALGEVEVAATVLEQFATLAVHFRSGSQGAAGDDLVFQSHAPRGVAACIVPWNYPLAVAMENVAPNLAVGNTVVIKPSEKTPLATRSMIETAFAGLPAGVCNVLLGTGPGAGAGLVNHPDVDVVVFVGSEATGRSIAAATSARLCKAVLELGGKDPFIIDDTVDISRAITLALDAKYTNAGQICTTSERFFVHRRVYDEFVEGFVKASAQLRLGDGMDPATDVGPVIDDSQRTKIGDHVADAVNAGAHVLCGGQPRPGAGFFYEPTVIIDTPSDSRLMTEETFGPVAPIQPFDTIDEAIAAANRSRYGLAAIVCTTHAPTAIHAQQALQAGMVKINTTRGKAPGATSEPHGASGLGHGYGIEFLRELTRQTSIHWRADL